MKRRYLLAIIILIVVGFGIWMFASKRNPEGKILGLSINSFYSNKMMKIAPPPSRISGISDPNILAESAVLIHEQSKYPLYAKNADFKVPIASLTKVMTAVVSLETYKLTDIIEVKKENTEVTPTVIDLKPGEKISVESLLYGLLMHSGNDAALALASGKMTNDEFVSTMNTKALELGLSNTKFKDPAGLDDQGVSSAMDIAILFSYALKNPEFQKIVATSDMAVTSEDGSIVHTLKNSNRLTTGELPLPGIIGGKTGYTPDAGHTLVSAATQNNQTLVGVVLKTNSNSPSASAEETRKLLTWGFQAYTF